MTNWLLWFDSQLSQYIFSNQHCLNAYSASEVVKFALQVSSSTSKWVHLNGTGVFALIHLILFNYVWFVQLFHFILFCSLISFSFSGVCVCWWYRQWPSTTCNIQTHCEEVAWEQPFSSWHVRIGLEEEQYQIVVMCMMSLAYIFWNRWTVVEWKRNCLIMFWLIKKLCESWGRNCWAKKNGHW